MSQTESPHLTNSRKLRARTISESLLTMMLVAGGYYLLEYVPKHVKPGQPVVAFFNYFLTYAPIEPMNEAAYVVPDAVVAWDSPAEIRTQIAELHGGQQVKALGHFRHWTHVRLKGGEDAWVSDDGLINSATHGEESRLLDALSDLPPQAVGHTNGADNVHVQPSRQTPVVAMVTPTATLEIFGRKLVSRTTDNRASNPMPVSSQPEAWYLVREGAHAGWILGRRVELDFPKPIAAYAQDTNLVAWVVLNTVDDSGRKVPQYVVADRLGTRTADFTDIRVLTWWKKKQTYAIAFKQSGLEGYFPIVVSRQGSVPYFRLRLMDDDGSKVQKVFGLFETMTHLIGVANTWQSDALPEVEPRPLRSPLRKVSFR